jgi:iron complex transport system substrate-binding protein
MSIATVPIIVAIAACAAGASPSPAPSASPVAPSPSPSPSPAAFPVTLTDDEGGTVALDAEPARIVSLTPAATEILFALGLGERVVGKVADPFTYPPEAAGIPDVAAFGSVDVERIVALEADLVIAGGSGFNPPDELARLRALDIPVLVVYAPDLATALTDIELIGSAVGRSGEARDLTAAMRADMDQVAAAVEGLARPRVFYELDASNGYFGPAPDYFGVEMIELAGGEPLTSGTPGAFQIPAERIVAFDPEVILLGDAAYGVTPDAVTAREGWADLTAVTTGAIRPVDDIVITRPGPRLVEGLRALVMAIHPDAVLPSAAPLPVP